MPAGHFFFRMPVRRYILNNGHTVPWFDTGIGRSGRPSTRAYAKWLEPMHDQLGQLGFHANHRFWD